MPEGYRNLTEEELSSSFRDSNENRFSSVIADFNGDKINDSAIMAVDSSHRELAVFIFIYDEDSVGYSLHKVASLPYIAIKYAGIDKIAPGVAKYYPKENSDKKEEFRLENDSLELFNSEGSSSVFFFDIQSKQFKQIWISK